MVRICGCVTAVWTLEITRSFIVAKENICNVFKRKKKKTTLVFRVTTTVFHIAPFVYVCWSECVCESLCLT